MALALVIGACGQAAPAGSAPPSAGASAAASAAPVKGGTLIIAIWQEPANLAPHYQSQTVQSVVLDTTVEGLVRSRPDGEYEASLAKSLPTLANGGVKISADGSAMDVTYQLQPGIKWSDGAPVTGADVKFTWQTWMTDPKVSSREGYEQIAAIDTPDELTAVMHYKAVYAGYLSIFHRLLAKHVLEKEPDISKSDYVRRPLGTGPFKITDFKAGESFTVERNPNYRFAPKPYLDKIIFKSVPSSQVAIAQLKVGEVQGMWNLLESEASDVEKNPDLRVVVTPSSYVERIMINQAENKDQTDPKSVHPTLGDVNVRRALVYATPKQQFVDKLLFGKARVGRTVLSVGWAAPKDITQEGYDPKKANELLDKAGWMKGADGIRAKGGVRASLTINSTTGNATRDQVEQVLVDEYKQIGVELKIQNFPSSVFLSGSWSAGDPRKRGSYDLAMYASSFGVDPHTTINNVYHSKNIPSAANGGIGGNVIRVRNVELDKAIDEGGATLDFEKRKATYARAMKILNDEAVAIWLYERSDLNGYRSNVQGWGPGNGWRNFTYNAADWWTAK